MDIGAELAAKEKKTYHRKGTFATMGWTHQTKFKAHNESHIHTQYNRFRTHVTYHTKVRPYGHELDWMKDTWTWYVRWYTHDRPRVNKFTYVKTHLIDTVFDFSFLVLDFVLLRELLVLYTFWGNLLYDVKNSWDTHVHWPRHISIESIPIA